MTIADAAGHDFPLVDRDAWRARAKLDATALAPPAGIEGIAILPLYDAPPPLPIVVPARARMGCIAVLPSDAATATAVARTIAGGEAALLVGPHAAAIADALPPALACWIEACEHAPHREVAGWLADPYAPEGVAAPTRAAPAARWLCDAAAWHDRGARATDEIAVAACGVLAAIRELGRDGHDASAAVSRIVIRLGMAGDVLVDVAKLRATRGLVHAMLGFLGVDARPVVHARTGRRVRSRLDADTNLVRATYETFAAACGGADALLVEPHDRAHAGPADVHRWARNLVHIARLESHLDTVDDPFAGSWAIENITADLVDAAWRRVTALEAAGGLASATVRERFAADVEATAEQRRQRVASGAAPIVGVSKFAPAHAPPAPDDPVPWLDLCRAFETRVETQQEAQ